MANSISELVEAGQLPADVNDLLPLLTEPDGTFLSTEGQTWDFKDQWPHSCSDAYFQGLCRLVCAFANTNGGIIIFGVDDRTRMGGKNKVVPNIDKFVLAFRQLTGESFKFQFSRYAAEHPGDFDVLLVLANSDEQLPLRFREDSAHYRKGIIWVRENHEVLEAGPRHISQLYCRANPDPDQAFEVEGSLPPSPATIRQFVGRMSTVDQIFAWLKDPDQPRNFLYGKGGSGKSTIAFEVARTLRDNGSGFLIAGESYVETVIFLSAKQRELNPATQLQQSVQYNDFADERTLYEALLIEGGTSLATFEGVSDGEIKQEVVKLFNESSCFIVIDDIDTLTTKGLEAGFEFLVGALWRAKKRSKILYTLRNVPTQALASSIEVPGLAPGGEYEEFITLAAKQLRVDEPDTSCRDGALERVSERRPLVLESVIALRRNTDSYERAIHLFQQNAGDDVRRYVFRREWDAIRADTRGRELLTVLALHRRPVSFDDLCALMFNNSSIVVEALAEVQEMFVHVERAGDSSTYELNELTRSFVAETAKELDMYEAIRTRVQKFITNIYAEDPALNGLMRQADRLIEEAYRSDDSSRAREAWRILVLEDHPVSITEDPRYMAICGYAGLAQSPPDLPEARTYFENSFAMRHGPNIAYIRRWFIIEQNGDVADHWTDKIFRLVMQGKGYSEDNRLEFLSRRAGTLYNLARENFHIEPERSLDRLLQALDLNAQGYGQSFQSNTRRADAFAKNFRNTAFYLKTRLAAADRLEDIIPIITKLSQSDSLYLDPLIEPIREVCSSLVLETRLKKDQQRVAGKLMTLSKRLDESACWYDDSIRRTCVGLCREGSAALLSRASKVREASHRV